MPHPHIEPAPADATVTLVATPKEFPIGWHPPDAVKTAEVSYGVSDVWDVTTRFL
jgi:hypothetical protein